MFLLFLNLFCFSFRSFVQSISVIYLTFIRFIFRYDTPVINKSNKDLTRFNQITNLAYYKQFVTANQMTTVIKRSNDNK